MHDATHHPKGSSGRFILHVDLDCFFAQVEENKNPELKGKPVVVGADPRGGTGRGVVCTANYPARTYGIHSAQPISQAYRVCPKAVFLPVDWRRYSVSSRNVMEVCRAHADFFQQTGIDEAFLDVSSCGSLTAAAQKAAFLKKRIREKTGLTVSIGVSFTKSLAKIASDLDKPDGLSVVGPRDLAAKIWPLSVARVPGVGHKTALRLERIGVLTIGDLAKTPVRRLAEHFGVSAFYFHDLAHGRSSAELSGPFLPKSFSRERTFGNDVWDAADVYAALWPLSREVFSDVLEYGTHYRTVGVKLRYHDFDTRTRAKAVRPRQDLCGIQKTAWSLIQPLLSDPRKIRLVGVRVSGLEWRRGQRTLHGF